MSLLNYIVIGFFVTLNVNLAKAQIANYVSNGGFEEKHNCTIPVISTAKYWRSIDSNIANGSPAYYNVCFGNVPNDGLIHQFPRSGNAYGLGGFLCQPPACSVEGNRLYFRNRLKSNLLSGKTYCVKVYINISNPTSYGIDGFGVYFGDNSIDTIMKPGVPLIYVNPHVQNPTNNILSDTMNWVLITGTFVATGIEKHMVIGNFKSDAATNKILINPTILPTIGADIAIDDVSCIPLDLPAYAGPDVFCIPGNSVYIGRPSDVGIDEACMWYKLPNTTTAIDTIAGLWVTPSGTSTYVVKQDICGVVKWDTVVVFQSGVGLVSSSIAENPLKLYPQPSADELHLSFETKEHNTVYAIKIYNALGQVVREEEITFKNGTALLNTTDLANGVYELQLSFLDTALVPRATRNDNWRITKKFVIAK